MISDVSMMRLNSATTSGETHAVRASCVRHASLRLRAMLTLFSDQRVLSVASHSLSASSTLLCIRGDALGVVGVAQAVARELKLDKLVSVPSLMPDTAQRMGRLKGW